MNKADAESILDNFVKWKACPASCLKKIQRDMKDETLCQQFLEWFNKSPAQELISARALVPEMMWEGYQLLNLQGLQEQDIFYAARKKMIAAFKEKYPHRLMTSPKESGDVCGTESS